jgi:predicted transcriptional regulator
VSSSEDFYNILFEVSNEDRHKILVQLEQETMNVTQISKKLGLSLPETSRHISRLSEVGLTRKEPAGLIHLTHFGKLVLWQVRELEFTTIHRDYFTNHTTTGLPQEFMKRIGDLADSAYTHNAINFLHGVENLIRDAEEYVWFQGDEYIMGALPYINEALERNVTFKIIEPEDYAPSQDLKPISPKELSIPSRPSSPSLEKKTLESIDVFLYMSEKMVAVAFPTGDGRFDYLGFTAVDRRSILWGRDLFLYYWEQAKPHTAVPTLKFKHPTTRIISEPSLGRIIIIGANDPAADHKTVQDAVDSYDEVILRGAFNFGSSGITISRSCVLKGEGRENGIPQTKIFKTKWQVPFTTDEWLIRTKGKGIDVTIENIHFTDFNDTCIEACGGNNLSIKDNRITIETGYARGRRHPYGDMVVGVLVGRFGEPEPDVEFYPGRVIIDRNYFDFAVSYIRGGHLPRSVEWEDPGHHPNLLEEYYCGAGIFVNHVEGHVLIQDNVVKNMNALGINASDCMGSAEVQIINNLVVSDIYGAHAHGEVESGYGITAYSAGAFRDRPGFKIDISGNTVKCSKVSYCGIKMSGPFNAPAGWGKFTEGNVRNNKIHLDNGFVGIKIGRNDSIEVEGNVITGKVYYGIVIHAKGDPKDATIYADENIVKDNDMDNLIIKTPDEYSNGHVDGMIFTGSLGRSALAHVWLDRYSRNSTVRVKTSETVIDNGEDNTVIFDDSEE